MQVAEKERTELKSALACSGFVGFRRKRARRADAAYKGQLERGIERVDPESEPEDVHLEAFDRARGETGEAEKRELDTASARGGGQESLPGVILADRGRREVRFQLGYLAQHPGGESVGGRPGPHGVFAGAGIGTRGLVDARDEFFDAWTAFFGD